MYFIVTYNWLEPNGAADGPFAAALPHLDAKLKNFIDFYYCEIY